MSQRLRADLALLVVAVIWGSAFVAQRVSGLAGVVYLFNGVRFLLAALLLLPLVPRAAWSASGLWRWMFAAGFVLFIASALQQAGLQFTTAGNAGFLTTLYVVFVPLLAFLAWRERPHRMAWVAVPLALAGAYLLSTGGQAFQVMPGDGLEIAGALFWAVHVLVVGKAASRFHWIAFAVGQYFVSGALNLGVGLVVEAPMALFRLDVLLALLYTAIFSVAIGYTVQIWAQRHTPPGDAALLLSLEAGFAVLAGWLLLGELLSVPQIVGCGLIFLAVLLAQFRELTSKKTPTGLMEQP